MADVDEADVVAEAFVSDFRRLALAAGADPYAFATAALVDAGALLAAVAGRAAAAELLRTIADRIEAETERASGHA